MSVPLEYDYHKIKPHKNDGLAFPVKKADVEKALHDAGVNELDSLWFSKGLRGYEIPVVSVSFLGESRYGYWMKRIPELHIHAIPHEHLAKIRELLAREDILNRVAQWLERFEKASNVVRDVDRSVIVHCFNKKLEIVDEEGKRLELP